MDTGGSGSIASAALSQRMSVLASSRSNHSCPDWAIRSATRRGSWAARSCSMPSATCPWSISQVAAARRTFRSASGSVARSW